MKNKTIFIISALCFAVFLFFMICVICNVQFLQNFDNTVLSYFAQNRTDFANYVFTIFSFLGNTIVIFVLMVILLLLKSRKRIGIPLAIITLISVVLNFILKYLINRGRPVGFAPESFPFGYEFPTSPSFPSGHSQTAVVFYFSFIVLLTFYFNRSKALNYISIILAIFFCSFIAFSRVYLGVHFPTDVLAGLMLGSSLILSFIGIYKNIFKNNNSNILNESNHENKNKNKHKKSVNI